MTPRSEWRFIITGWLVFVASAVFFIWAALNSGDWISITASVLFFIACLFFLVPVWHLRPLRE